MAERINKGRKAAWARGSGERKKGRYNKKEIVEMDTRAADRVARNTGKWRNKNGDAKDSAKERIREI